MTAPILSIEEQIAFSTALDASAKRVGLDRNVARALLADLGATVPIADLNRMILGACDHHARTVNRAKRLRR